MKQTSNYYNDKYDGNGFYWGLKPSDTCYLVMKHMPPEKPYTLLDIGCDEGRYAVFFARNGYKVTAFDLAAKGVEKTKRFAEKAGVEVDVFQADIPEYRLNENFDILFSTGTLHYIPPDLRKEIFDNFQSFTGENGIHMFSLFVRKPFIEPAPEMEINAFKWISGELFTYYQDWRIDYCTEEIFDCMSSGVPHKHATNRILARKVAVP